MLEETKRTELENKESLAALLRIEEERKRIIIRKPPMYSPPMRTTAFHALTLAPAGPGP